MLMLMLMMMIGHFRCVVSRQTGRQVDSAVNGRMQLQNAQLNKTAAAATATTTAVQSMSAPMSVQDPQTSKKQWNSSEKSTITLNFGQQQQQQHTADRLGLQSGAEILLSAKLN